MPVPPLLLVNDGPEVREGLERIREEMEVPGPHSGAAVTEAERSAEEVLASLDGDTERRDARSIDFVTIDPPGSQDLDQALHIEQLGTGWRVHYAIADVPAFVSSGGPFAALDAEVSERGVTYYLPDARSPLHPAVIGEDAASLLPGQDRPAVLWTIDLDSDGVATDSHFERAVVRSRARFTYAEVQAAIDSGRATGTVALLAEVGPARQRQEAARNGVSLDLPTQRITHHDGAYGLEHEQVVPAMGWNAQISLLTGMVAAEAMLEAGVGLLRTLPPPDPKVVEVVRRTAGALGVEWPDNATYQAVVRNLDGSVPDEAALLLLAARGLRGAGYLPLLPGTPVPSDPAELRHAAVAAPYSHVTAPLRRLCDRAAIEVCLAVYAGRPVPDAVLAALPELPATMARTRGRQAGAARAAVDLVESLLMAPRVGEVIYATVVSSSPQRSVVVISAPAIEVAIDDVTLPLGDVVPVRVQEVDPVVRSIVLTAV